MRNRVFRFKSYKAAMAALLTGTENRGKLTKAAEAIGCQRSYLSRVISEKLQLTPDHAFGISRFFKFSKAERSYFLKLVELERSSDPQYRDHLESELVAMRRSYESIEERTERASLSKSEQDQAYFSSWLPCAIHFLTSIPGFQTAAAISERLCIPSALAVNILQKLEDSGLVEQRKNGWIFAKGEFHLGKLSPHLLQHHQNWRQRALLDAQNAETSGVHFTAVQTFSEETAEALKQKLLDFIAEFSELAGPSSPEDAFSITVDMFRI